MTIIAATSLHGAPNRERFNEINLRKATDPRRGWLGACSH